MLVGVVGKPSSGKSTFFKALTMADAEIASYPFTTIKPNHGIGFVKTKCACQELGVTCDECKRGWRFVPVELLDVAGLVPGASKGKGMGNQFLDDLRKADVLIQVVDASGTTNAKGEKCEPGTYDPEQEIRFLKEEIDQWFYTLLEKDVEEIRGKLKHSKVDVKKELLKRITGLNINEKQLMKAVNEAGTSFGEINEWTPTSVEKLGEELRKQSKPIVIAANKMDLPSSTVIPGAVPTSALAELVLGKGLESGRVEYTPGEPEFSVEMEGLSEKKAKGFEMIRAFLKEYGSTGVQECLNKAVFDVLDHRVVYPVEDKSKLTDGKGRVLPDAFLMPPGSNALDLAFAIHEDIGEGFVKAFNCRTKKTISKDYELEHCDVIKIFA